MIGNNFDLIIYLAEKTKLFFPIETSTNLISQDLKISQQTISRKLRELEKEGMIIRDVNYNGHTISLTDKSIRILKEHSRKLQDILKTKKHSIKGTLVDGLGEGGYYISLKRYKESIRKKLGFSVYSGTLNLKIKKSDLKPFLNSLVPVKISGFKTTERTFGEITCYKIKFKNIKAAIVVPERSRYDDILEIIAPINLRNRYNLKSGDKVTLNQ